MENDNLENQEILDDDIMQCRADILRNQNQPKESKTAPPTSEPAEITGQASEDIPVKRSDVVATRVNPFAGKKTDESLSETADSAPTENKIRIPQFEDLIASENQIVDGLWETPVTSDPEPDPQIGQDEETYVETANQLPQEQTQPAEAVEENIIEPCLELDPDNIVTAEEEQALFSEPETEESEIEEPQSQTEATEEGLDALRKVVAEAKNQAQPEIDELEDIEDVMKDEEIQQIADEKTADNPAENINETTETMNVTDLPEPAQDRDDIAIENIQEDCDEEITSGLPDEAQASEEPEVKTNVPKFDLAEQILKEQRQVASKRRQRPAPSRNLNVMPIAGTVGQIIKQAKKAVAAVTQQKDSEPIKQPDQTPDKTAEIKPVDFDNMEVTKPQETPNEPVLSVAACRIINESDRLNPFQEDIIIDIVSRDIARFCGELTANC